MPDPTKDPALPELDGLPRETELSPELEKRVVSALRREGLLAMSPTSVSVRLWRWAFAVSASVALFAAGWWTGHVASGPAAQDRPTYALLLREGNRFRPAPAGREMERVSEYVAWAAQVRKQGVPIRGTKLSDDMRLLAETSLETPPARPPEELGPVTGFFLVRARDFGHALKIAQSCPHVRYGGVVEIRSIDGV